MTNWLRNVLKCAYIDIQTQENEEAHIMKSLGIEVQTLELAQISAPASPLLDMNSMTKDSDCKASVYSSESIAPQSDRHSTLRKIVESVKDDSSVLITGKPKNKSKKFRKSNRHSIYRGVSLNGKKWQVMIMGQTKKNYFGGLLTELEAAIFYDRLAILTNGLAAKTNFNYTKSQLQELLSEADSKNTQLV